MGAVAISQKQIPEAIASYTKAIEAKPDDSTRLPEPGTGLRLDSISCRRRKPTSARPSAIDPKNIDAYANLARFYIFQGQRDKAIETLQQGIKANPDVPLELSAAGGAVHRAGTHQRRRNGACRTCATPSRARAIWRVRLPLSILPRAIPKRPSGNTIADSRSIPRTTSSRQLLVEIQLMSGHVDQAKKLNEEILKAHPTMWLRAWRKPAWMLPTATSGRDHTSAGSFEGCSGEFARPLLPGPGLAPVRRYCRSQRRDSGSGKEGARTTPSIWKR